MSQHRSHFVAPDARAGVRSGDCDYGDLVAVVVVLYGSKAVGKSQVAETLRDLYGVFPVDADAIVLDLLSGGGRPDPRSGWLVPVEAAVLAAMQRTSAVSVEATGAWDSDWQLASDLEGVGARVVRVWICAPLAVTLERLARRTSRKAPMSQDEARWIWRAARARACTQRFDLVLDTEALTPDDLPGALAPLASLLRR